MPKPKKSFLGTITKVSLFQRKKRFWGQKRSAFTEKIIFGDKNKSAFTKNRGTPQTESHQPSARPPPGPRPRPAPPALRAHARSARPSLHGRGAQPSQWRDVNIEATKRLRCTWTNVSMHTHSRSGRGVNASSSPCSDTKPKPVRGQLRFCAALVQCCPEHAGTCGGARIGFELRCLGKILVPLTDPPYVHVNTTLI